MDMTEKIHCLNITQFNITSGHLANTSEACVSCFFPQNCLENNTCLTGVSGLTCELCDQTEPDSKYYLFGNSCILCEQLPWSAISFAIFCLVILTGIFIQGFTQQLCTKLKIIVHFFQLLILSVHVKSRWPPLILRFISMIGFGSFTASIIDSRCIIQNTVYKFYIEWLTALGIPTIIIVLGLLITNRQHKCLVKLKNKKENNERKEDLMTKRMMTLRRILFFIAIIYFMPIVISVLHSFSCTSTFGEGMVFRMTRRDVFLYDNTLQCDSFSFQTVHLLLNVYMFMCILLLLFLILFTLRQKKWNLLESQESEYGFAYDSYKKSLCFWEALPMLRKLISLGITDTVLTHSFHQFIGVGSLTVAYLLLLILFRPYRNYYWKNSFVNNHLVLDIISNIGILVVQTGGFLYSIDTYPPYLDYIIITIVGIVIVFWILTVLLSRFEKQTFFVVEITRSSDSDQEQAGTSHNQSQENLQLQQTTSKKSVVFNIKNNKVSNQKNNKISNQQNDKVSNQQNNKISNQQNDKVSNHQNDKVSNQQNNKVSNQQNNKVSNQEEDDFDF